MGIAAGFIPDNHTYIRYGCRFNPDPNAVKPTWFSEIVSTPDYVEYWSDELQIFHNPNAKRPLDEGVFRGVTQHFFRDGEQYSTTPEGVVLASHTGILQVVSAAPPEPTAATEV